MPTPRRLVVDSEQPGLYHCISRCVRRAHLCGDGYEHRKQWIQDRLHELTDIFAIELAGYAVLGNHLHLVLWTGPDRAARWSATEIARRWVRLFPKSCGVTEPGQEAIRQAIRRLAGNKKRIELLRQRLSSLSWFMRCLCEPIARRANEEDECSGRMWEGRFKCQALLDEAAVLACMVYVDLNVVRARLAATPETSAYTSVKDRVEARRLVRDWRGKGSKSKSGSKTRSGKRRPARAAVLLPHLAEGRLPRHDEDGLWLNPIEDRAGAAAGGEKGRRRRGLFRWFTLDEYLELVDATGRVLRGDKRGAIPSHLEGILKRLDVDPRRWPEAMGQMKRLYGTAIGSATALAREATRRGMQRVVGALDVYAEKPAD